MCFGRFRRIRKRNPRERNFLGKENSDEVRAGKRREKSENESVFGGFLFGKLFWLTNIFPSYRLSEEEEREDDMRLSDKHSHVPRQCLLPTRFAVFFFFHYCFLF